MSKLLTLRVTPPTHPETTPRLVEVIKEAGEHTNKQRAGETIVPQEGEEGGVIGGGGGRGGGRMITTICFSLCFQA